MPLSLLRPCALSLALAALAALAACNARVAPSAAATAARAGNGMRTRRARLFAHQVARRYRCGAQLARRAAAVRGWRPAQRPWVARGVFGPADANGSRIRLVFGIATGPGLGASRAVPTNITVIVEGGKQLYATQGEDKCQIESMVQEPVTPTSAAQRAALMREYRIAARGYCIDPAASFDGSARLDIDRFDFSGLARFAENELYASNPRH